MQLKTRAQTKNYKKSLSKLEMKIQLNIQPFEKTYKQKHSIYGNLYKHYMPTTKTHELGFRFIFMQSFIYSFMHFHTAKCAYIYTFLQWLDFFSSTFYYFLILSVQINAPQFLFIFSSFLYAMQTLAHMHVCLCKYKFSI